MPSWPVTLFLTQLIMKSITDFPDSIPEYAQKGKENYFPPIYGCSCCTYSGKLHRHGFYERNVITFDKTYRVFIARKICPICGKTYSQIPDFLIPYFQYSYQVIITLITFMFIDQLSFLQILNKIRQRNSLLSKTHLSFYRKRFIQPRFFIRLFFTNLLESVFYNNMNFQELKQSQILYELIEKIQLFSDLYQQFNLKPFHFTSSLQFKAINPGGLEVKPQGLKS